MRHARNAFALTMIATAMLLASCGDDAKNKAAGQGAAPAAPASSASTAAPASTATPASTAAAPADPLAPRYDATLAQGIDFRKPGYPTFISEATGISGVESWGRWTDGSAAKLRFSKPLPAAFTLVIEAGAIGPNSGKPVVVRIGKAEQTFTVNATAPGTPPGLSTFTLKVDGASGDTIEIVPPRPVRPVEMDPKSTDNRLLGIGLVALKIQ